MWDAAFPYVAALLPTVAVATLFYFLIKTILEGDRRERLAQSKWEREHRRSGAAQDFDTDEDSESPRDSDAARDKEENSQKPSE